MSARPAITDTHIVLRPDPTRVVTRLFVPGREDVGPGDSRAVPVIERIMQLSEADARDAAAAVTLSFSARHLDFASIVEEHVEQVISRLDPVIALSSARRYLLGACFTHEYSVEAAALCNPSIVLAPGVSPGGDAAGDARFVMSVRGIGEGHRSTIGFRTGAVSRAGHVVLDDPAPHPTTAPCGPGLHRRAIVRVQLAHLDDDNENAEYVLDLLPDEFDGQQLEAAIASLGRDRATRRGVDVTIGHLRALARSSYGTTFAADGTVSSRVLWPHAPLESQGMEDARFVRFVDDSGQVTYYATYTGWDGRSTSQQVLETTDFVRFAASPVAGSAATGKGLALFPRLVGGRYAALSRSDRETNAVAFSDDPRCWADRIVVQVPERPWEILQLGNCGSPIETDAGWLVLTHGVGALRTYHLGALLLDITDPTTVLARSHDPILSPDDVGRDGYVPNVVYSCGGMAHGDVLVVPFGIGDQSIGIVTYSIADLLDSMVPVPHR